MKKLNKIIVFALLTAMLAIGLYAPAYANDLPVRLTLESLGAVVTWQDEDRSIHIAFDDIEMIIFTEQALAHINGEPFALRNGAFFYEDRAYMSLLELDLVFITALLDLDILNFSLTPEARDIALYDFDYMVNLILENSVWDNVVERRFGINFAEHTLMHRNFIESMQTLSFPDIGLFNVHFDDDARSMAANYLAHMLFFDFSIPLGGVGHLAPRELSMYTILGEAIIRAYHSPFRDAELDPLTPLLYAVYTNPNTIWFYGEIEIDWDADDDDVQILPEITGNITTAIIDEGIAYFHIGSFMGCPEYDDLVLLPFLEEVKDFDHLIIDLRGNGGGIIGHFSTYVMSRLMNETVEVEAVEFFTSGALAVERMQAFYHIIASIRDDAYAGSYITYLAIHPAAEFAAARNMTYFDPYDLERFSYAFVSGYTISPAEDALGFNGKIWLLVDGDSASASEGAAGLAYATDFATIVGTNTAGVMASIHTYYSLPNTGIIWRIDVGHMVDAQGRSLETYGITPQILNFQGMDALQTVLALIALGQY